MKTIFILPICVRSFAQKEFDGAMEALLSRVPELLLVTLVSHSRAVSVQHAAVLSLHLLLVWSCLIPAFKRALRYAAIAAVWGDGALFWVLNPNVRAYIEYSIYVTCVHVYIYMYICLYLYL